MAGVGSQDFDKLDFLLQELREFQKTFRGVGTNLNQIALGYNMEDVIEDEELKESHEELREAFRAVDAVLKDIQKTISELQG